MPNDTQLLAFQLELIKLGAPAQLLQTARQFLSRAAKSPALQRGLGGVGAGAGVGGAGGAVLGAGAGGLKAYREARERGATAGEAVSEAVGGAGRGAVKGGLTGAAVGGGALGGLAAKGISPELAGRLVKAPGGTGAAARFGQRQVHSLTGWTPKGFGSPKGVREMRGGAYGAQKAFDEAQGRLLKLGPNAPAKELAKAKKDVLGARKAFAASEKAEQMGLTSIPGYAKALARSPGKSLKTGIREQWHSGPMGKAFVALPVGVAAKELVTEGQPGAPGRLERAGEALGELAYAAGPVPLVGSTLIGGGISKGLSGLGRLADKKKGSRPRPENPAPPSLEPAGGATTVDEYIYSPAATGERPEIGYGV